MKRLFFFAAIAIMIASCTESYKSTETPIEGTDLIIFSAQTPDKKGELYGVKNTAGQEIIKAEYTSIAKEGNYLVADIGTDSWLFKTDGSCINEQGASITVNDSYVQFYYGEAMSYYYFEKYGAYIGPFLNVKEHNNFLFVPDKQNIVLNLQGDTIVSGDKVVYLFSVQDSKDYFLVTNGKATKAYDNSGKELFKVSAKKMKKLPQPEWICGENISKVRYRNKLVTLK